MICDSEPSAKCLAPLLRYRDVAAATEWLCRAFGFEVHATVRNDAGTMLLAQLRHGQSLIMLVPVGQSDLDGLMRQPDEIGGAETQGCYIVVDDADAHYARSLSAGVEIVLALTGERSGRRGYSCRDFEGHIWSFGTYNPWSAGPPLTTPQPAIVRRRMSLWRSFAAVAGIAACFLAGAVWTKTAFGAHALDRMLASVSEHVGSLPFAPATNALDRPPAVAAEQPAITEFRQALAKEQALRMRAEQSADVFSKDLARETAARAAAEKALDTAKREKARLEGALSAADRVNSDLRRTLAEAREQGEARTKLAAPVMTESPEQAQRVPAIEPRVDGKSEPPGAAASAPSVGSGGEAPRPVDTATAPIVSPPETGSVENATAPSGLGGPASPAETTVPRPDADAAGKGRAKSVRRSAAGSETWRPARRPLFPPPEEPWPYSEW